MQFTQVLRGENAQMRNFEEFTAQYSCFKFATITSCDVERSFSIYKPILSDNRKHFLFDNLKMHFVNHC